ncbi:MAG: hypothetical protein ACYS9X_24630 [Planctomycetota bacterium]|jgi:hypothetical protein
MRGAGKTLRQELVDMAQRLSFQSRPTKSLTKYADLTAVRTWRQRWNPETRTLEREPIEVSGTVWSGAIERSLDEQNALFIPEMPEPIYLERSIVVGSGARIVVHPRTEIRMIIDDVEHCLIRNRNIVSGQAGPVELCRDADRDILIEGGIWSDQKNNGHGPQGFRKGKEGLMLGSQGAIVLSNVENVAIRNVIVRDNSSFGFQIGNARDFLIEGVRVDGTKDGVHLEGPAEMGVVRDVKGPLAGDDVVALNAWDWRTSSLTFGSITDILVEDVEVDAGSCAIRILPGVRLFPDGSTLTCNVERCVFTDIRNCHTFKIYDQPNIRCVSDDYSADLGTVADLFFEDIHVVPLDLTKHHDKSKTAVFDLCENARGLHFENIRLDYVPGGAYPKYLLSVGPKSSIRPIPFRKTGTQEIYNPLACPVADGITLADIATRDPDAPGRFVRHENPGELVHCTSCPGGGAGTVSGVRHADR